jgi:hypothetical protein
MIQNCTPVICQKTIADGFSPYWINIFYTRTKIKDNQFGVIFPFKMGEPKYLVGKISILEITDD